MRFFTVLFFTTLSLSCSTGNKRWTEVHKKPVHTITCKYHLQGCHLQARGTCPNSYWVNAKIRRNRMGGPWGAYTEWTMKYYCK